MPKSQPKKRNSTSSASPYGGKPLSKESNFLKMKTNIGQHVLKNPGVAQAIVDKADLKQSDVRNAFPHYENCSIFHMMQLAMYSEAYFMIITRLSSK